MNGLLQNIDIITRVNNNTIVMTIAGIMMIISAIVFVTSKIEGISENNLIKKYALSIMWGILLMCLFPTLYVCNMNIKTLKPGLFTTNDVIQKKKDDLFFKQIKEIQKKKHISNENIIGYLEAY